MNNFKMLWKKETEQIDALYVDIFARCAANSNVNCKEGTILVPTPKKDDQISHQKRFEGNELLVQQLHSCAPNIDPYFINGRFIWISSRPIKKGEKLVGTLVSMETLLPSTMVRQQKLREIGISCDCERCNGQMPMAANDQRLQIMSDIEFLNILTQHVSIGHLTSTEISIAIIYKCTASLSKYQNFPWCDEIATIIKINNDHLQHVLKWY